jgi:hypothetical protein
VSVAATLLPAVFAVIGPYGVLFRIFLVLVACGAAIGAAAGFVKLREAVRDG